MTAYNTLDLKQMDLSNIDASWRPCVREALKKMDPAYLAQLIHTSDWLPGIEKIFNAFSLPVNKVNYVLFGESPYPRADSANGYAFWDAAVEEIWTPTGLSKRVNRATSLRNFIKMLLIGEGLLDPAHCTQTDIANVDKTGLVQTNSELFGNLTRQGFLLLNASLVLGEGLVRKDAVAWQPFIKHILTFLFEKRPGVTLILLGNIANAIDKLIDHPEIKRLYAEHPYNLSFIQNPKVIKFFKPFRLLVSMKTSG